MPLVPQNTQFPTDLRGLPWPEALQPHNGEAADEITLSRSFNAAFNRTDTLKTFLTGVESRLLTRFFAPIQGQTGPYAAAELARIAQEAAAIAPLVQQAQDTAAQARDVVAATTGTLIYYQGQDSAGFELLYALDAGRFRDSTLDLVVAGTPVTIPVVGLVY